MNDHNSVKQLFIRTVSLNTGPIALANKDIQSYYDQPGLEDTEPWALKPEIPSEEEILGTNSGDTLDLAPNNIEGPWISKEAYLQTHYNLLREDSVAPLRDAVAYVREKPHMMDSKDVSIYDKVYVVGLTFAQQGLGFRIQFSTQRSGKRIIWEYSKRLISGAVVALSPAADAFQTKCVLAIVAARPLETVQRQPPMIDIYFSRPEDAAFDPHQEWIMVEAKTGYYEASRHTMSALQKMSREKFPLAENICFLMPNVEPPLYIRQNPVLELQSAIDENELEGRVNVLDRWPNFPTGDLDITQWEALHQMLTKSLTVVQGPPGTGKTFVSIMALKVLISNMKPGDPPVIVSSHTNHALDQLLVHISRFEPNYIRLGSRSSDLEIKKRTLFNVRKSQPTVSVHGSVLGSASGKQRSLKQSIMALLKPFDLESSKSPIPCSLFFNYGLLTQSQYDSLSKGAKNWIRPGDRDEADPISAWLGDQLVRFKVTYAADNFGFIEDEIDLEYEQLKELEAEHGVEEDDFETLKGDYIHVEEGFKGFRGNDKAAIDYSKYSDLWEIPVKERGAVYNALRKLAKEKVLGQFRQYVSEYMRDCKDIQIGKWERDNLVLQTAKVIGVTATGLSKYRGLISSLKPRIVLIEEAAEVIEAPIAAACLESVQHMILVGDHQQLKGHCAVQELGAEPFFLEMSMFERLVRNGLEYVTLRKQRRMAPEIRRLLTPIYGELQDHESVHHRPSIPGMGNVRSFFFCHNWPETSDSLSSKMNETEAEMIVGFYVHLVLSGVSVKDITILTFYNGQRKKLLKLLRSNSYLQGQYVKVVTVDSYQGEENEIVILSLVRGGQRSIGFLAVENRVCVALSRARSGFFIFGNARTVASANPLWREVLNLMASQRSPQPLVSTQLPLTCSSHGNTIYKKDPSDWSDTNGGCGVPCEETLECGHRCPMLCHGFSHDRVQCDKRCDRQMRCGHFCSQPCSKEYTCTCKCPLI
ncbi:P-loop containing nucleoside triphosphate hydrolase protein [Aspergillus floccosus]